VYIEGENRLIQLSETESKWMTEMEVMWLMSKNIKFMDVTDHQTSFAEELPNGLGGSMSFKIFNLICALIAHSCTRNSKFSKASR
jgi:hypothetical protein